MVNLIFNTAYSICFLPLKHYFTIELKSLNLIYIYIEIKTRVKINIIYFSLDKKIGPKVCKILKQSTYGIFKRVLIIAQNRLLMFLLLYRFKLTTNYCFCTGLKNISRKYNLLTLRSVSRFSIMKTPFFPEIYTIFILIKST